MTPSTRMKEERLAAEDYIDAEEHQLQLCPGQLSDTLGQFGCVHRDDLRHVCDRIFWEPSHFGLEEYVARSLGPPQRAGQRYAYDGTDPTTVERVSLHDDDGSSEARFRPRGLGEVSPPYFALRDHHDERRSVRLAAAPAKSFSGGDSAQIRSSASVTYSGPCFATYSRRARQYNSLRDFLSRRASFSAAANTSSGIEIAVFIPRV